MHAQLARELDRHWYLVYALLSVINSYTCMLAASYRIIQYT